MKSPMSELTRNFKAAIAPLRKKEESRAIQAARAYLGKDLSDRFRVFGAEVRIDKPEEPRKAPARMIGVLVVDYGNRRNFEILVEPGGKVVRVDDVRGTQPAYADEEIGEARSIAERDERVARFAKTKGVFVSAFGPERTPDNARRIGLRYVVLGKVGFAELHARVVVDLSAGKLVGVEDETGAPQRGR